ncbi:MAG: hypothetical protein HS111_33085 [Kofleriaceae bacterium]|nr:hypothetical protein [Kofleriaceae bacterium]
MDGLDLAVEHAARAHRGLEQVAARNLGTMRPRLVAPTWWPARPMRCSPRAIALGDLDLHHQIDRAHVDAELERELVAVIARAAARP